MNQVAFRFYEELNDYLPENMRKVWIESAVNKGCTVGEKIHAYGLPLDEVDLVLVNQQSRGFDYPLMDGDRVSVYPQFELLNVSETTQVREKALRNPRFICDVHLGKLCKYLRMLGWDTHYSNQYTPEDIIGLAKEENRMILSRNVLFSRNKEVERFWWVRSADSLEQLKDIVIRLDLSEQADPLTRCLNCNGLLEPIEKPKIAHRLEVNTAQYYNEFFHCITCDQVYWKGSHYENMLKFIDLSIHKQLTP
ncbi:MAG TPA: Mut7-C RNAse domain-containing protein [Prolixibacteraceae bacterium]|nr:Mut7-C RNAse domain-containing protein [Prolixibacteraceae bacterium]